MSIEGVGWRRLKNRRLAERLKIKFESSSGNVGKIGEPVFSLRTVDKEIVVAADVDVHARFHRVLADDLGEVVGEFVTLIGIGELKTVSAENETGIRILNGYSRRRGRRSWQIEVEVASVMKTKFVDGCRAEGSLQ